ELSLLLVGPDERRRGRRGVELLHFSERCGRNRLLGPSRALGEVGIVARREKRACRDGQSNGGPAPDDGVHLLSPHSTRFFKRRSAKSPPGHQTGPVLTHPL